MSKLELPFDIANKVVSMLRVKSRPFAVLIVRDCKELQVTAQIHEDAISQEERVTLEFIGIKSIGSVRWWTRKTFGANGVDNLVYTALSLGFTFRSESDRVRWINREPFEMYRDAVREIA